MKQIKNAIMCALACVLCAALAACGSGVATVASGQTDNVITVNASSQVKAVPDKASFSVEVYVQAATAEDTQERGSQLSDAVLEALTKAGVEEKNIQTSYTNLSPIYDWSHDEPMAPEEPAITGYEMRTSLEVSEVDIDLVTGLMETCVQAGATGVYGPSYYVSNYDEAYAQALAEAITASKQKATAMADAAGVRVGGVVSIVEGYQNTAYRATEEAVAYEMAADSVSGSAMKLAPGEVDIEAQVTVSYAIR